jgi:hypothetical protein
MGRHGFIQFDCRLERIINQAAAHVEFLPVRHKVTHWKEDMASKKDGDGSNVLSFPGPSPAVSVPERDSVVTAEGLLLMHAFLRIGSSEDRQKVIALAERLGRRDDETKKE